MPGPSQGRHSAAGAHEVLHTEPCTAMVCSGISGRDCSPNTAGSMAEQTVCCRVPNTPLKSNPACQNPTLGWFSKEISDSVLLPQGWEGKHVVNSGIRSCWASSFQPPFLPWLSLQDQSGSLQGHTKKFQVHVLYIPLRWWQSFPEHKLQSCCELTSCPLSGNTNTSSLAEIKITF